MCTALPPSRGGIAFSLTWCAVGVSEVVVGDVVTCRKVKYGYVQRLNPVKSGEIYVSYTNKKKFDNQPLTMRVMCPKLTLKVF